MKQHFTTVFQSQKRNVKVSYFILLKSPSSHTKKVINCRTYLFLLSISILKNKIQNKILNLCYKAIFNSLFPGRQYIWLLKVFYILYMHTVRAICKMSIDKIRIFKLQRLRIISANSLLHR